MTAQPRTMQCMEVWGGTSAADDTIATTGLNAWVYARPFVPPDADPNAGGGDIYYLSSCATGRITRILLADVSGHGPAVAQLARELRDLMRRYVNYLDLRRFVRALNTRFVNAPGTFATALVASYWEPTRWFSLCVAGHPPPLRFDAKARRWAALAPPHARPGGPPADLPLGVLEDTTYHTVEFRLKPGDLVLFYTDAAIEAQAPDGSRPGPAGLLHLLADAPTHDPPAVLPWLVARLDELRDHQPPDDDLTLLLVQPNSLHPRRSLADLATVAATFVHAARQRLAGKAPFPWPQPTIANLGGAFIHPLNRLVGRRDRP